jgi:hypothetical protein
MSWGLGSERIANNTLYIGERTGSLYSKQYRIAMNYNALLIHAPLAKLANTCCLQTNISSGVD